MSGSESAAAAVLSSTQVAQGLKERVYATFTGLSILLVMQGAGHSSTPVLAALTLLVGIVGIMAASFVSDVIAHLVAHRALPTRQEMGHLVRVSVGGLLTLTVPLILLILAALGVVSLPTALNLAVGSYLVTLTVIGYLAVRRADLRWPARLLVLSMLTALGVVVIGLQLLAHA